jgi:hypothetical protein
MISLIILAANTTDSGLNPIYIELTIAGVGILLNLLLLSINWKKNKKEDENEILDRIDNYKRDTDDKIEKFEDRIFKQQKTCKEDHENRFENYKETNSSEIYNKSYLGLKHDVGNLNGNLEELKKTINNHIEQDKISTEVTMGLREDVSKLSGTMEFLEPIIRTLFEIKLKKNEKN